MKDLKTMFLVAGLGALGLGGLGLGSRLPAQESDPQAAPPPTATAPTTAPTKTIEQSIADLGSDSYRTRLQAESALKKQGKAALPALRKAADDASDNEVQWRSRRLVRQIERGDEQGLVQRSKPDAQEPAARDLGARDPGARDSGSTPQLWTDRRRVIEQMQQQFDSLFERFERDFGLDVPRAHFFQDNFFQDLQDQLESGKGNSQGMSVQIDPDGAVHVEVNETNEKGETEKKIYDAPDLDSFHRQYPGVLQKNGLGLGLRPLRDGLFLGPNLRGWGFDIPGRQPVQQPWPWTRVPSQPDAGQPPVDDAAPTEGKRLGLYVHPSIPAELRLHLGLEDSVGLMVESVQADSLAATLGLERGDIVTRIGAKSIGSTQDVQDALGGIESGQSVEVGFLRKGAAKTATAKKPAVDAAKAKESAKVKSDKLEPRRKRDTTIR
ncbi:MAG: PDZ domain-containing protein [Planctomycetota bacterium]